FALFKSEPPSGRNPKQPLPQKRICTQPNPTSWSALRPPSGASPLPHLDLWGISKIGCCAPYG
ncbi:hypothetical protein EUX57_23125, partial [Pseudomonas orientalis]